MRCPTSADMCRANGWKVGDVLEGTDDISTDRIRITAIGEVYVFVCWQYADMPESADRPISLDFRDWHKVVE